MFEIDFLSDVDVMFSSQDVDYPRDALINYALSDVDFKSIVVSK